MAFGHYADRADSQERSFESEDSHCIVRHTIINQLCILRICTSSLSTVALQSIHLISTPSHVMIILSNDGANTDLESQRMNGLYVPDEDIPTSACRANGTLLLCRVYCTQRPLSASP